MPARRPVPVVLLVRIGWVLGFLVGTTTHILDLVLGGATVYAGFPDGVRVFWIALTVLDPLVVTLTVLRLRAGVVLGCAVMIADVAVNATVFALMPGLSPLGLVSQIVFGVFVLLTAPLLWRAARRRPAT